MAIIRTKEEKKAVKAPVKKEEKKSAGAPEMGDKTASIIRPRITEKASLKAESQNVYVFDVEKTANKKSIAQAIQSMYKVQPIKVAISAIPTKKVFIRGKFGTKGGGKKAYVYLKKGDKIEIV